MESNIPTEAVDIHNALVYHLKENIVADKLQDLKQLFKGNPLTQGDIDTINDFYGLSDRLMTQGKIAVGNYEQLVQKLQITNRNLVGYVKDKEKEIKRILDGGPSPAKQPRMPDPDQQQYTEIHPDLKPLIDTTKAKIKIEKEEKKFYTTKGFRDAKDKLLQKKVVIIKGNTGDGKTAIAVQLIHWLNQEKQDLQPLEIHKIEKLDLLAPNLKLITFIDDIFGEKDVCQKDVWEWNKRISVLKTRFVDKEATNFLVITIRNEVFNSLKTGSRKTILTNDHTIDLSSNTYKIEEEKKGLLDLYKPKEFSWLDIEKDKIVTCAPNIGFPQCCQLFCNSVELQKKRVKFFENPFDFLNEALSNLQECSAILYLFFNDGMIRVKDLDPNGQKINKKLLDQAFNINLIPGEDDSIKLTGEKKVTFVKESLEKLSGFLVVKEKRLFCDKGEHRSSCEDVYRFHHDSIYVAVALLYGKATPFGYIQNCPSKCLSYLTTSGTATNMIVISPDHYTDMCERLLREFECKKWYKTSVGSLDVWKDPVFVQRFVGLLNERKIDKLAVLDEACESGAEECALYLLSEGVIPDEGTALSLVISEDWNDGNKQLCLLEKIIVYVYLDDETKLDLLNKACESGAEECALYLLSKGVKPDKDTALWSLVRRRHSNKQLCLLKEIVVYLNDEAKLSVLNEACKSGAEKCAFYILSEGAKPDEDTALSLVSSRHWNDGNKQLCLLKKIVVYLNETKRDVLNGACRSGAEECALYLLCEERVKPDEETVFSVVVGGSIEVLRKLLEYDVIPTARSEYNDNVLHLACEWGREEMVTLLCYTYPHLVLDTDVFGRTPLHRVTGIGNVGLFQTMEKIVLNSLYRVENQQTKCESVDGCVVHKYCVCAQYMTQLVDRDHGWTVLHWNCGSWTVNREVCLYLCRSYPGLIPIVDKRGRHCLHHIARGKSDVDVFTGCETYIKQYVESTGGKYDITTILTNDGKSVLDKAKERAKYDRRRSKNNRLLEHLVKVFGK